MGWWFHVSLLAILDVCGSKEGVWGDGEDSGDSAASKGSK